MKGILGRKIGMTQVFTDHGEAIAVSIIEVKSNVITAVLTKEKNGYDALQLAIEDRKKAIHKKPEIGHFAKANTVPKKFVKEIKDMKGFEFATTIDASIFKVGELVDVIGVSKGKGFAGAIKRHNQSIGPKSHGGGGGSQPQRQTGSLGDISGNKVVKGMTMPGHMGAQKTTMQNLEIVAIDLINNALLVKGSIPGPKKSFVIIREAIKGLPSKTAINLVNVNETKIKNALLEEAKKAGADVNTDMTIEQMKLAIDSSLKAKEAANKAHKADSEAEKLSEEANKIEAAAEKAHSEVNEAKAKGDVQAEIEAKTKADALDKQAETIESKATEAKKEAVEAEAKANATEAEAEKLQIKTETESKKITKEGEK